MEPVLFGIHGGPCGFGPTEPDSRCLHHTRKFCLSISSMRMFEKDLLKMFRCARGLTKAMLFDDYSLLIIKLPSALQFSIVLEVSS